MDKGGYQIIDLKRHNFTDDMFFMYKDFGRTILDIVERCEKGLEKPILISGLTVNNVEYPDMFGSVEYFEKHINENISYGYGAFLDIKLPIKLNTEKPESITDIIYIELCDEYDTTVSIVEN